MIQWFQTDLKDSNVVSFGHNCNYYDTFPASPCSIANENNQLSEQNRKLSTITKGLESIKSLKDVTQTQQGPELVAVTHLA